MFKAILWDVDGTLAETERDGHRATFNLAFEEFGIPWRWDERHYGELLNITGGRERLLYDMVRRGDAPAVPGEREHLARAIHARKNSLCGQRVRERATPLPLDALAIEDSPGGVAAARAAAEMGSCKFAACELKEWA